MSLSVLIVVAVLYHNKNTTVGDADQHGTFGLQSLLAMSDRELREMDIAKMNLVCAQGLRGAEELQLHQSLLRIDAIATRVRSETERHQYRFQTNPGDFDNSEGFFRMLMLSVVLAEDFCIIYSADKIGNVADARLGDGFFANSRDVFIHGLIQNRPRGTCSSLPVLQVALGRRLGYPLKLVTTRGHLFVRWEDARERFNLEAGGRGVNRFPDDYYRHWPVEVSENEVEAEGYLKSLTPSEELAVFLSIRGMCLNESGRLGEAITSFANAARLAPGCNSYRAMQECLERRAKSVSTAARSEVVKKER